MPNSGYTEKDYRIMRGEIKMNIIKKLKPCSSLLIIFLMLPAIKTWSYWYPDCKDSLNINSTKKAFWSDINVYQGTPYITWEEKGYIYVKHYQDKKWVRDGYSLNVNAGWGAGPEIEIYNGTPYVVWCEFANYNKEENIFVKRYSGDKWNQLGNKLNIESRAWDKSASIAVNNRGIPYVAWQEEDSSGISHVYVKHWNEHDNLWERDGSALNKNMNNNALSPCIVTDLGGKPFVTWCEEDSSGVKQVQVKFYSGISWWEFGNNLNINKNNDATHPKLIMPRGKPYLVWSEAGRIYVKTASGTEWEQLGQCLNENISICADWPRIDIYNNAPYVAWEEEGQTYVKYYNQNQNIWEQYGDSPYIRPNRGTIWPSLAIYNGVVYVSWSEMNDSFISNIYAKHYEPDVIYAISKNHSINNQSVSIEIFGTNFNNESRVKLTKHPIDIHALNTEIVSPFKMICNFNLLTFPGVYDLQVVNPNQTVTLPESYFILNSVTSPAVWNIRDIGDAVNHNGDSSLKDLIVCDSDYDGLQEVIVAPQEQNLYICQKNDEQWTISALKEQPQIEYYNCLTNCDADKDGRQELYGATLKNQIFQYKHNGTNWLKAEVGSGDDNDKAINALVVGDGDNNNRVEVYAASEDGTVYQYNYWNLSKWIISTVGHGGKAMLTVAIGDLDHDEENEIYAFNQDGYIYQFKYNGSSWDKNNIYQVVGKNIYVLLIDDIDMDGSEELYGACSDGKIYKFNYNGEGWEKTTIGSANNSLHDIVFSDGDNDGRDEIYSACADGHVYQYYKEGNDWQQVDLGFAGSPLYALDIGDGDNDNQFEIYTIGANNHVYQFKTISQATPTPTATVTNTPTITKTPTVTPTLTPIPTLVPKKQIRALNSRINPARGEYTIIRWYQPESSNVTVKLYNLRGEWLKTLINNVYYEQGQRHEIIWRGLNAVGSTVGSGIYIVYIKAGDYEDRIKVAVIY